MSTNYPGRGIPAKSYSTPLRKPGQPPQNSAQDGVAFNPNAINTEKLAATTLNVNAKEFVPRFTVPTKPQDPAVQPAVQPAFQPPDQQVVDYVKETLDRLTYNPGEFDLVVDDLALAWKARIHDVSTLNEVARVIIEQSIVQTNFTYTGARLCDLIARRPDLNDIQDGSKTFRSIFLTRCSEEHKKRDELLKVAVTVSRVHGFAMFLAELFSTFRFEGKPEPVEILGKKLLEMLITLLKHRSDDSLLYAGRILKLTGSLLEDPTFFKQEVQDKLTEVFNEIQSIIQPASPHGRSIKVFLESVVSLRAKNWGRETSPVPVANSTTSTLSADAPPFQFPYSNALDAAQYPDDQGVYYPDDVLDYYDDDITPVYNADQWNEYCEDNSEPDDNYYENGEEDEAFTEEMRKDFDQFMLEQQNQPPGS